MIKFNEIKMGDFLMGEFEGKMWEGEVINLNGDEKQVCLATEVQDFWFETEDLYPIPVSDDALSRLNFLREDMPDGSVKYKKGSFRMLIPKPDDFSRMDIWYRDDKRINPDIHYVHQLQNHYLQMTKVHLTSEAIA
jgi:hypothetical protein